MATLVLLDGTFPLLEGPNQVPLQVSPQLRADGTILGHVCGGSPTDPTPPQQGSSFAGQNHEVALSGVQSGANLAHVSCSRPGGGSFSLLVIQRL